MADEELEIVREALLSELAKRGDNPITLFGNLVRASIDQVLDGPRTGRFRLDDLDRTEKTHIGLAAEFKVKEVFGLSKGARADLEIRGVGVDVKFSTTQEWMIGSENVGGLCLGIGLSKKGGEFAVGLFRASEAALSPGRNKDQKRRLSAEGRKGISWIVDNVQLPPSFIEGLPSEVRSAILQTKEAQRRARLIAELIPGQFIPRNAIMTLLFGFNDPMRRIRYDKRNPNALGEMRFLCTDWVDDRLVIESLGYTNLPPNHWIAFPKAKLPSA